MKGPSGRLASNWKAIKVGDLMNSGRNEELAASSLREVKVREDGAALLERNKIDTVPGKIKKKVMIRPVKVQDEEREEKAGGRKTRHELTFLVRKREGTKKGRIGTKRY